MRKTYVIVKCQELGDCEYEVDRQWNCDVDRQPIMMLVNATYDQLEKFRCYGYEIYVADGDGNLDLIQDYDNYKNKEVD